MQAIGFEVVVLLLSVGSSIEANLNDPTSWFNQSLRDEAEAAKENPTLANWSEIETLETLCFDQTDTAAGFACLLYGEQIGLVAEETRQPDEIAQLRNPRAVALLRRALKVYARGCLLGNVHACIAHGSLRVVMGDGNGFASFERACALGSQHGCTFLATSREAEKRKLENLRDGVRPLDLENRRLLERACDGDVAKACAWLGVYLDSSEDALSYSKKACRLGRKQVCRRYGFDASHD